MFEPDIIGLGIANVDLVLRIKDMPTWKKPGMVSGFALAVGGPAGTACAVAALQAARWMQEAKKTVVLDAAATDKPIPDPTRALVARTDVLICGSAFGAMLTGHDDMTRAGREIRRISNGPSSLSNRPKEPVEGPYRPQLPLYSRLPGVSRYTFAPEPAA